MSENNETVKTREQLKKDEQERKSANRRKRLRVRLIPIWLRLVIVVILTILCSVAGTAVGYGILGNGKVSDIFQANTWTHIVDLVEKQ